MAIRVKFTAVIIDHELESSTQIVYVSVDEAISAADIGLLRDAWCDELALISAGTVETCSATLLRDTYVFDPPAQTVYGDSEDKALFEFRSQVDGSTVKYQIAAPKASDFLGDAETVNPADANVSNFITWIEANAVSAGGANSLKYILGYRRRSKSRRENPGRATAIG